MAEHKHVYSPMRAADTVGIMAGLFDRSRDRLTDADLDAIAGLEDRAVATLRALGKVAEGLYCLVLHDAGEKTGSGAMQDADAMGEVLQLVAGVTHHATGMLELRNAVELERMGRGRG
jgi:hypothetical protein